MFFVLGAGIAITAGIWQQQINKKDAVEQQKKLNNDLIKSHMNEEFIKGKLSAIGEVMGKMSKSGTDSSIKQMASAIEKIVQSSYQTTTATNKQICSSTMDLAKRMHKFAYDRRERSRQIIDRQMTASRTAKTEEERHQIFQQYSAQSIQQIDSDNYEFRTTILGEAIYLKDELLKRLPPQPKPNFKTAVVFEGSLAGAYPEDEAADYLEGLSRKLCPQ